MYFLHDSHTSMHIHTHIYFMPYNSTIMLLPLWFTIIIPVDMFHHPTLSPDAARIAELHRKADQFIAGGLTPSTIATNSAGKKKYIQFCTTHQATPLPSSETALILFASYLTSPTPPLKCTCQLSAICM